RRLHQRTRRVRTRPPVRAFARCSRRISHRRHEEHVRAPAPAGRGFMIAPLSAFAAGLVFGFGLWISGMANPRKVLGFLDVTGAWDASLLFVLGGAVGVAL